MRKIRSDMLIDYSPRSTIRSKFSDPVDVDLLALLVAVLDCIKRRSGYFIMLVLFSIR